MKISKNLKLTKIEVQGNQVSKLKGGGDVTKDFQRSKGQRSRLDGNNN